MSVESRRAVTTRTPPLQTVDHQREEQEREKKALIECLVSYALTPQETEDLSVKLLRYSVEQLRDMLKQVQAQYQARDTAAQIVQDQLAQERAALAAEQERLQVQAVFTDICRIPINGKTLVPNDANLNLLQDCLNPGEELSAEWFRKVGFEIQQLNRPVALRHVTPLTRPVRARIAVTISPRADDCQCIGASALSW